jgi:hypothetical protein
LRVGVGDVAGWPTHATAERTRATPAMTDLTIHLRSD